jgi:myo-inositol-1-phosphate synthase
MQFNKEIRMEKMNVKPATGKLGVLCVGLGAVTSTFMTGVLMARKGLAKPVGSMTQYDKMRVGRGENKKYLHYGEIVPLASYSVHGMFIRLMPMSQLLMQKFCKRKISIL